MTMLSKRSTLVVLTFVFAALVSAIYAAANHSVARDALAATEEPVEVVNAHGSRSFDFEDKRKVVGFSDRVFEGRVVEQVSNEGRPTSDPNIIDPRTQFSVQVLDKVKGNLPGTVVVEQNAGYHNPPSEGNEDRRVLEVFKGDELLEPGRTYVFSVKYDNNRSRYVIGVPGYGNVSTDGEGEAKRKEVKDEFKKAKNEEIDPLKEKKDEFKRADEAKAKAKGKAFEEKEKSK